VAFETNCRINPVPLVVTLTNAGAIWFQGGLARCDENGAWCVSYRRGVSNCSYSSIDQCLATVRGLGGFCRPNPFPGTAYATSSGSWNVPDSPKRYRRPY
jgi:hypothetical protein